MLSDSDALRPPADQRTRRALVLLLLASRTICCVYASTVVAVDLTRYQHRGLAIAALLLALSASCGCGALIWRAQAVSDANGLLDAVAAGLAQLALVLAIRPEDRLGSLNWALAYSVSCASWLALGKMRWWRVLVACSLGAAYGAGDLSGGPGTAMTVTALANALSPPLYFGIAASVFAVILRIARELDAGLLAEQRRRGEAARLAERQRLFRDVHNRVLTALDTIALGALPEAELRARARSEAMALRRVFADPTALAANGFRELLADLVTNHECGNWTVQVVDDEMATAPPPATLRALCDAIAELLADATVAGGSGQIRIRASGDDEGASITMRVTGTKQLTESALARARARMTAAAGTVSVNPALPGESRIQLRAPA